MFKVLSVNKIMASLAIILTLPVLANNVPAFSNAELKPGGDGTLRKVPKRTFMHPVSNESLTAQMEFWIGFSFFRDPWVAAPAITSDRDGLGPLYNARSCKACHSDGGRGAMPKSGEIASRALLFRFLQDDGNVDPRYGGQLQPFSVRLSHHKLNKEPRGEAQVRVDYEFIQGSYADGGSYTLRKPIYTLLNPAFGDPDTKSHLSARYTPAIYGMGLLDAIDKQDLLVQEDPHDKDNDGISARYNKVKNVRNDELEIGRFGFKGLHPTLEQQIAGAFVNDIGITNPLFPEETCLLHQQACLQAASVEPDDMLDLPQKLLDPTTYMSQTVAVAPARNLNSKRAQNGRTLFYQLKCNGCHTPFYVTSQDYPVKALAGQKIWPYTDLALHDMGPGLADKGRENLAHGREWRTPPLWGLGLQKRVQGTQAYLHDGRAETIEQAILWHGGEAKPHKLQFTKLTKDERQALIFFLKQI
ncbi:hypothetical protein L1285_00280 [Pseudoalteromonas sp. DL2-H2.2]|uniref:di-heme oxidoreductase family protein n=1 Tax=Pseudoalteromonas sp. DL2-H2.2 TaxID=2908889 RepID=UPI001F2C3C7C|nr:di-heme oxidoredictase family protein [Pseudoalteromonas sp. DL2-H2.2]MCF2906775.1 hypothetical protein [Pseudoalteromonas sp. DL2-H2.2]